jgi:hypothetical protein
MLSNCLLIPLPGHLTLPHHYGLLSLEQYLLLQHPLGLDFSCISQVSPNSLELRIDLILLHQSLHPHGLFCDSENLLQHSRVHFCLAVLSLLVARQYLYLLSRIFHGPAEIFL